MRLGYAFLLVVLSSALSIPAQSVTDSVVRITATTQVEPPTITLVWPNDPKAGEYELYRKPRDAKSWGDAISLGASASGYTDTNVVVVTGYEYRVLKYGVTDAEGYLYAGIELPLTETRDKVVLLVDRSLVANLSRELWRFQLDLIGDGWQVIRHDMPRMSADPSDASTNASIVRSNELASTKALIKAVYINDPSVRAVILIGHLPVPYSGDLYPDGHLDHRGAWPADAYYADMTGTWEDRVVNVNNATNPRGRNTPGDGKFDAVRIPAPVALEIGRIDFANLPAFDLTESELLRRYFNKNHAFRHRKFKAANQALIDDRLGVSTGEPLSASAWGAFSGFFGTNAIDVGNWLPQLTNAEVAPRLWAYGSGPGTFSSVAGVVTSQQLATTDPGVVFTMFFGSYLGDWDSSDNLMRAAIATPHYTLASFWSGRPRWQFHHMALGETLGFSTRVNQNNLLYHQSAARFVHVALMGDPTLRMHIVAPPTQLTVVQSLSGGIDLTWQPSPEPVLGYAVYRAANVFGPFVRLNAITLTTNRFSDTTAAAAAEGTYMVRAIRLETSASGSYFNASQGAFQDIEGSFGTPALQIRRNHDQIALSWSANATDHQLYESDALNASNWLPWSKPFSISSNTCSVSVDLSGPIRFFQLKAPSTP